MAGSSVIINGVTYPNVPSIEVPLASGSGNATFVATADGKAAATYKPSTSDQTISGGQYLAGAQTIAGVTVSNLQAQYIANGVTVKVGCSTDDDCVTVVTGSLSSVVISQDSTSKVLSIS